MGKQLAALRDHIDSLTTPSDSADAVNTRQQVSRIVSELKGGTAPPSLLPASSHTLAAATGCRPPLPHLSGSSTPHPSQQFTPAPTAAGLSGVTAASVAETTFGRPDAEAVATLPPPAHTSYPTTLSNQAYPLDACVYEDDDDYDEDDVPLLGSK